jgi:peptidyl-prolyl cis-trans isomerase SurA
MTRIVSTILLFVFLLSSAVFGQREVLDKIIAVVGDEVILASELANQLQITVLQNGVQPKTEAEAKKIQDEILEQMISDRLFLLAAREDTTIVVREAEIEEMLDQQVARISQNFEDYNKFLDGLAAEGLTVRELKKKFRADVENQILKQRFIQQKLYSVSVSKHEVETFYTEFSDSIPTQPEGVRLSHILLRYKPSRHVSDSVKALAEELRQKILDGADFAALSSQYSMPQAGANGGDLGYLSADDVVPEFARAAFQLKIGDISGVVETQFGIHIIKCEGKKDDRLSLRHILLDLSPTALDTQLTHQLGDSLINEVWTNDNFEELAKIYSDDDNTRPQGGELGWYAIAQLPIEFGEAIIDWKEPGEARGPVTSQFGIHLIKLLDYQPEKQLNIIDDFDQIKEMARQDKTGRIIDRWIEDRKKTTYTKINLVPDAN